MYAINDIEKMLADYLDGSPCNTVPPEKALRPDLAGMRIFDAPLAGCCAADDPCLLSFAGDGEAGLEMRPPAWWQPSARSVLSVFLPFAARIKDSNGGGADPSPEWMHGRIEGQACVEAIGRFLLLELEGQTTVPVLDGRFAVVKNPSRGAGRAYMSNWSERHVAFAAGLGTFSLNGGLITRAGMAGRLVSVVTSVDIARTPRPYTQAGEYCIMCGMCAANCPAGAIRAVGGKDHLKCSDLLDDVLARNAPYYGCGKCQTAVPCASRIPSAPGFASPRQINT
jgi:epoxyqueuosine reductase QueG